MNDSTVVHLSTRCRELYRSEQLVDIEPVSKVERLCVEIKLACLAAAVIVLTGLMVVKLWGMA
jgi:hypothetical protein